MPSVSRNALVPYAAERMYALVNDIERYPEFLPGCTKATVHSRDEDEVRASISLRKGGIEKSFTTHNRLQPGKMIEVRLVEGPFRHLQGFWRFQPLSADACKVTLDLDFEFSGKMVGLAFGPVFHQVANTLVDSFCKRATQLYGAAP